MKKWYMVGSIACALFVFAACGGGSNSNKQSNATTDSEATSSSEAADTELDVAEYDPHRGEGKFDGYDPGPVNSELVAEGKSVYESKCQSCHKLSDELLVGPGWEGVTDKHSADWILNFLTNTDAMLDKDPELQEQIEICMVRMPNQNLTDDDAKGVYDFMRENDGK